MNKLMIFVALAFALLGSACTGNPMGPGQTLSCDIFAGKQQLPDGTTWVKWTNTRGELCSPLKPIF